MLSSTDNQDTDERFQDEMEIRAIHKEFTNVVAIEKHINNLHALQSAVMEKVDNGTPLSINAVRILSIGLESGFRSPSNKKKQIIVAIEHFTNKAESLSATYIAAESISETLKSAIKKLGEMLSVIWEKIKEFLKRIFGRNEKLTENIKAAMDAVKNIPDSAAPVEEFITSMKIALEDVSSSVFLDNNILFAINGKCNSNTAKEIINNTAILLDINRLVIIEMMSCLRDIAEKQPKEDDLEKEAEHLVKEIKNMMDKFTMTQRKNEGHQMVYSYGYFYDSTLFKMYEDIGKQTSEDEVRLFNIQLEMIKQKELEYKVEVLSKREMADIGVATLKLIEKSKDFEKVIPIINKAITSTTNRLHNILMTTEASETSENIFIALSLIKDIFHYVKHYLPKLSSSAVRVASDATTYVRTSVARYTTA